VRARIGIWREMAGRLVVRNGGKICGVKWRFEERNGGKNSIHWKRLEAVFIISSDKYFYPPIIWVASFHNMKAL
jgi:hypothetical protein